MSFYIACLTLQQKPQCMTYVRYEHGHLGKSRIICNEMIRIFTNKRDGNDVSAPLTETPTCKFNQKADYNSINQTLSVIVGFFHLFMVLHH